MTLTGLLPELLSEVATSVIIIIIIMVSNNIVNLLHPIKGWDASLIFSNRLF